MGALLRDRFLVGCAALIVVVVIVGVVVLEVAGQGTVVRSAAIALTPAVSIVIANIAVLRKVFDTQDEVATKPDAPQVSLLINGKIRAAIQAAFAEGTTRDAVQTAADSHEAHPSDSIVPPLEPPNQISQAQGDRSQSNPLNNTTVFPGGNA